MITSLFIEGPLAGQLVGLLGFPHFDDVILPVHQIRLPFFFPCVLIHGLRILEEQIKQSNPLEGTQFSSYCSVYVSAAQGPALQKNIVTLDAE